MPENDTLTAKQRRGVVAVLSAATMRQAARDAGVSSKTLYRWLGLPAFREALALAQAEAVKLAALRLTALLSQALEAAGEDLDSGNAKLRSRAWAVLLSRHAPLAETLELEARITELEQRFKSEGTS